MTHHLETIAGFVSTIVSAAFGSIALPAATTLIAQAAGGDMPDWMKWIVGPVGALIGMVIAIKWLTARLDKAEKREEDRQVERDAQMKAMIELGVRSTDAIEQNSETLSAVKDLLKKP